MHPDCRQIFKRHGNSRKKQSMQGCIALPGTSLLTYEINHFRTGWLPKQGMSVPARCRAAQQPEGRPTGGILDKDVRTNGSLQSESVHFIINTGYYKQHSRGPHGHNSPGSSQSSTVLGGELHVY